VVTKSKYVGELPKQYDPNVVEAEVNSLWDREQTYQLVKRRRSRGEKFYFLDGPPFPSSDLPHIGTSWNKVIKDTVIRYKRSRGFNVRDQPGYDCHGLPIELAIEQKFGVKSKKEIQSFGLERFISECRNFAEVNAAAMTGAFEDLGIWMDWKNPYMTHEDYYVECDWWGLKQAWSKGLLDHGQRVVHWCPRCETVLSDYEVVLAYTTLRDPSIYVKFPLATAPGEYILIWTTTPWTLPSNVAVMVNPSFEYAKVKLGEETYILAKDRIGAVQAETGQSFQLLDSVPGSKLEGLTYRSPLQTLVPAQHNLANAHRVVLSTEYVTLTEGTGCVHSAPGHGEEDYEVGERNNLPVLMLVDDQGRFLPEAGKYAGKPVRDANHEIIEDLKSLGFLLHAGDIEHRSPVCWRCKTPLLIRATKQWLIRILQMKDLFVREVDSTLWIPEWAGANQFKNWLQGLKDWVISRQRFWGTPLPVWICSSCGKNRIVGSRQELLQSAVSKVDLPTLHRPWVDAVMLRCDCGGEMSRVEDVIDVWFESGGASLACLDYPAKPAEAKFWWPADFIVEGRDQITAWFFGLLRHGIVTMGRCPYKTVLMHGFALDSEGREMHKSLGNFVTASEVTEKFGRDAFRYYVLQTTLWEDLQFSWGAIRQYHGDLGTIWNTYVFASTYMSLDKFAPAKLRISGLKQSLRVEDRWLLSRTNRAIKEVTSLMDDYKIHEAVRRLKTFLVEDLSHTYVRYIRRRTWVEKQSRDKLAAYATLYTALKSALTMLTPIMPYLTESVYQHMFRNADPKHPETVHLLDWPKSESKWIVDSLEEEMRVAQTVLSTVAELRMAKGLKQRQPVPQILVASDSDKVKKTLRTYSALLREQANTRRLRLVPKNSVHKLDDPQRFANTDFPEGAVFLDLKLSKSELAEGLARDTVRRMQQMRKEMDLKVDSFVHAYVITPSTKEAALLKSRRSYIAGEVRAKHIKITTGEMKVQLPYYTKRWQINGATFEFGLCEDSKLTRKSSGMRNLATTAPR
jgi:isoleucyl-tRNA synthetase